MGINIIKRNGSTKPFDPEKIRNAIKKAGYVRETTIDKIVATIAEEASKKLLTVEEIQDLVEIHLMNYSCKSVAKDYIRYRNTRELIRKNEKSHEAILELIDDKNEYLKTENSNKNERIASTQRDYIAGEVSKDITMRLLLPPEVVEAHKKGIIHFHDSDYFIQHVFNCCLVNLEDIFQNGTVINGTKIETPKSFVTACTIATQIAAIIASNQYGGQTMSLAHLAPFVDVSRKKITADLLNTWKCFTGAEPDPEKIAQEAERRVKQEVAVGIQTIQYQVNTLNSSNGQTPFITLFAYLNEAKNEAEKRDLALVIEEVFIQRMQGVKNECGQWVTPAFPKLIYVLEADNHEEGTEYWELTKLAAKCTAKRMVPDYISEKIMLKERGYTYSCMGCRSFLSPWMDKDGKAKFYGRFNQGVVTLNLPYLALLAQEEKDPLRAFWTILGEYAEVAHKGLQARHARLWNTPVETSPLHWMYGALARLPKGSTINELLVGGYSSISLGYAGLYECVRALTGHSHTDTEGKETALKILRALNDYCETWKEVENIGYAVYGTPIESTTYKFAQALKDTFGEVPEVSDHDYITNSYHVSVREEIDPFTKLKLEAEFQNLSKGGCISYVETSNLQNNPEAVLEVIKFIYDNIMYAELNTKSDYCQVCGSTAEIKIEEDNGKLIWKCPNCGNTDQAKMNVTRRTCGLT